MNRTKEKQSVSLGLFTLGIAALFIGGLLMLVVFGAVSYRTMVSVQRDNDETRALSAYLLTTLTERRTDPVRIEDSSFGQVLVVSEEETGYAIRIYCHEGELVEDYARDGSELNPLNANPIGTTGFFEVREASEGLLAITTDAGEVFARASMQEGGGT